MSVTLNDALKALEGVDRDAVGGTDVETLRIFLSQPMLTSDEADDLRDVLFFYDLDKSHPAAYEKLIEIAEMDD